MKEPRIIVRLHTQLDVLVRHQDSTETRIATVTGEGIRFFTAWEADEGYEAPGLWPSNFKALADSLPAITAVIDKAEDDLLAIQLKLNEGQKVAQSDIDALNADS